MSLERRERIKLEPFSQKDFDKLISWVNDEEMLMQFSGPAFTFPLTYEQLLLNLEEKNRYAYKVVNLPTDTMIGYAEIFLPTEKLAVLCRIIIGNPVYRGQGLGQQIVHHLLKISFTHFATKRVELNVFDWNINAIKCYEKVGFSINTDKFKKREIKGQTWTAVNMAIDRVTWEWLK